ncbi:nucleotidyltransferase family protein [Streptomyces sp. R44]|uniref:Nucleotidyltransferase family protein n=1 Tax=Streptomyces sp. R44 TaxID=3238633 RepID=A0AB39TCQ7_9ACTN
MPDNLSGPLLELADSVITGKPRPGLPPQWDADDWNEFPGVVLRGELDPLVGHWFSEESLRPPRWARHAFRASLHYHRQRNTAMVAEARRVQEAAAAAGVPLVFRKGAAVCTDYPDLGLRPFTDLDVLIRKEDAPAVAEALAGIGYQQASNVPGKQLDRQTRLFYALATTAIPPFFRTSDDPFLPFLSVDCATTIHLPRSEYGFDFDDTYRTARVHEETGLTVAGGLHLAIDLCANLFITNTTVHYLRQERHHRLTPFLDLHLTLHRNTGLLEELVDHALRHRNVEPVAFSLGNLHRLFPSDELNRAYERLAPHSADSRLLDRYAQMEVAPGLVWDKDLRARMFSTATPPELPEAAVAL